MNARLRESAAEWGADFFGVADLTPARKAVLSQGGPVVAAFPRAVSIGIRLPDAVVNQLPQRSERAAAINYRLHAYDIVNQRLDHIASRLSSLLQNEGHSSLPVPAAKQTDEDRLSSFFSHKLAAHLAGLGWIGKNCLLITPQVGPRVRWATVLTNAPLMVTGEPMAERCGNCRECIDICPASAFTGRPFHADEPREMRLEAHKCDRYLTEMEAVIGLSVCGLCLYACPYGRR